MEPSSWNLDFDRAVIGTAVHNGHDLRPEVATAMKLDPPTRLREEDPHTGLLASYVGSYVVVNRSRFEVDLNRPPDTAVYVDPADSWDLEVWEERPGPDLVARSRALHDDFFRRLGEVLTDLTRRHGGFVLYDVHSYNHRRGGPEAEPDDPAANPVVNLGTGTLPGRWRPVADAFLDSMSHSNVAGEMLDARENVKFQGRYVARFVHDNFADVGCALAIDFKKIFVDEWSDSLDEIRVGELGAALAKSVDPVTRARVAACR